MVKTTDLLLVAATAAGMVSAHGNITSPPARLPGPAMVQACGQDAVDKVLQDGTIPLESLLPASASCASSNPRLLYFLSITPLPNYFTKPNLCTIAPHPPIHLPSNSICVYPTNTRSPEKATSSSAAAPSSRTTLHLSRNSN